MAQITEVRLVDDIDGGPADETVEFQLDGKAHEIDLASPKAAKLREHLAPFIAAARRAGRTTTRPIPTAGRKPPTQDNREQNQAIREWGKRNGMPVSERGRIPAEVIEAFHQYAGKDFLPEALTNGDVRPVAAPEAAAEVTQPKQPTADPFQVSAKPEDADDATVLTWFRSKGLPLSKAVEKSSKPTATMRRDYVKANTPKA